MGGNRVNESFEKETFFHLNKISKEYTQGESKEGFIWGKLKNFSLKGTQCLVQQDPAF